MKRTCINLLLLVCGSLAALAQPRVVAHRGYWRTDGSAQNSIASFRKAAELGCYGSEFDVWMTADGVPVVFHDATMDGIKVEDTMYAELMNHRLDNGEYLPTLQQYLQETVRWKDCRLVLEIKPHRTPERESRLIDMAMKLVRELGLEDRTDYISFSIHACKYIHEKNPKAMVAFLGSEIEPKEIKAMGLTGIDYNLAAFEKHPEWLEDAKRLGLEVNVWTVDGEQGLRHHAALKGIDLITTNDPQLLIQILGSRQ